MEHIPVVGGQWTVLRLVGQMVCFWKTNCTSLIVRGRTMIGGSFALCCQILCSTETKARGHPTSRRAGTV